MALGRAVLTCVLCLSLLVGPLPSAQHDRVVSTLLVTYAGYSLLFLAATRSRQFVYRILAAPLVPTAVDVLAFTALLYLTSGALSPFFSPFVFLIISATIQWGSRGALYMGLITMLAFLPAGWDAAYGAGRDAQATQTFIVRIGYVFVISVLLATFGRHVERMVEELSRLSHPFSDEHADDADPPVDQSLRHALWVFGAKTGAFLWGEPEEPYLTLTVFDGAEFDTRRLLSAGEEGLINPQVADAVFLFDRESGQTFLRRGATTSSKQLAPLSSALLEPLAFERALVIPASTPGLDGWVLVFDHEEPANEDLAVGAMVGAQIAMALERWENQAARRAAAAAEDRIHLARDLHDGVLQFLAGAGLRLDAMVSSGAAPAAQTQLASLRQSISDEQRELRGFISTLRPTRGGEPDTRRPLGEMLDDLAGRLSRHWSVTVESSVGAPDLTTSDRLAYDIGRIVREAVANAVRHGKAQRVRLEASRTGDRLVIHIADDGCGFPFQGRRTDAELSRSGVGPRSLHERVRALTGQLTLNSTNQGATLTIDLPLREAA